MTAPAPLCHVSRDLSGHLRFPEPKNETLINGGVCTYLLILVPWFCWNKNVYYISVSTELLRRSLIFRFNEKWFLFFFFQFKEKIIYYLSEFIIVAGFALFFLLEDLVKETKVKIPVDDKVIMTLVSFKSKCQILNWKNVSHIIIVNWGDQKY